MPDRQDPPAEPTQDLERRRFFRRLAGDVVSSVGSVIGAAQSIQLESAEAARELLALGDTTGLTAPAAAPPTARPAEIDASTVGYRAPFRWDVDACRVVDQRRLPDVITEVPIVGAADAVNAINDGVVLGSAVQAQVAAVALAIVAMAARTSRPFARRATIRGAANALRLTRPGSAAMAAAIERMLARLDLFDVEAEGYAVAMGLREEAEAIVFEATDDHGALVTHGVAALPGDPEAPLHVLTAGSTGAMGGGQLGTALSVITAAHHAGRPVQALVAETRPTLAGSRIAAWELGQAGVPYAIVTDAAAPGCIAEGEVAVVIVAADRIARNGDVIAAAGTYPLALAADAARIPFLVCAPTTAIDPATATGEEATIEEGRPGPVLRAGGTRVAPEGSQVRNPAQDLTPASLVTSLVTEEGGLGPPFGPAIEAAIAAAAARRAASPGFAELLRRAAEAGAEADVPAAAPAPGGAAPAAVDDAPAPHVDAPAAAVGDRDAADNAVAAATDGARASDGDGPPPAGEATD